MDKRSQGYEINSIQSTLESQAFIFSNDLHNNIKVRPAAALSARGAAVIYAVVQSRISRKNTLNLV